MKIRVRLTPNASRDEIVELTADGVYRIKVQSPPVEGKANRQLVRFLAKRLGVAKSGVRIAAGGKSRNKMVEIDGDEAALLRRLNDEERTGGE